MYSLVYVNKSINYKEKQVPTTGGTRNWYDFTMQLTIELLYLIAQPLTVHVSR